MKNYSAGDFRHRRRYEIIGHARYLTFSCYQNRPFLMRRRAIDWTIAAIAAARDRRLFDLWAWVIMPTHIHLLLRPCPDITAGMILTAIKQSVSKRAILYLRNEHAAGLKALEDHRPDGRVCYRFWQKGGGYDRNIWSDDELCEKIQYIHANPVRRGLARHPADWPWSSWHAWTTGEDYPLAIDRQTAPRFPT